MQCKLAHNQLLTYCFMNGIAKFSMAMEMGNAK